MLITKVTLWVALMNMGTELLRFRRVNALPKVFFYNYLTVDDDDKVAKAVRGGGFGSTGK